MTHTPTPWQTLKDFDISIDGDAWEDGRTINGWVAVGNPDDRRFAIAICDIGHSNQWDDELLDEITELVKSLPTRVNTHDALVKALNKASTALDSVPHGVLSRKSDKVIDTALKEIAAALALAKGEGE